MTDLIACGNKCRDVDASGALIPRPTEGGRAICEPCCERLWKALGDLPDLYLRLRPAIMPGSVDRNPETKATKRVHAPAPVRLDPIDLSDERHYLIGGSLPVENVRGVVGILQRWANAIRVQQGADTNPSPALWSEIRRIENAFDYMVRQPWAPEAHRTILAAVSDVKDAVGEYKSRPVGRCPVVLHDEDSDVERTCGGPLLPMAPGVRCVKCNSLWPHERLRQLGAVLA